MAMTLTQARERLLNAVQATPGSSAAFVFPIPMGATHALVRCAPGDAYNVGHGWVTAQVGSCFVREVTHKNGRGRAEWYHTREDGILFYAGPPTAPAPLTVTRTVTGRALTFSPATAPTAETPQGVNLEGATGLGFFVSAEATRTLTGGQVRAWRYDESVARWAPTDRVWPINALSARDVALVADWELLGRGWVELATEAVTVSAGTTVDVTFVVRYGGGQ